MRLKRKIGIFMCCLAVTGMFSVGKLPVQAAQCTHPRYLTAIDVPQYVYYNASGHYEMRGTRYECPACGYTYWEGLHSVKVGDHAWYQKLYPDLQNPTSWDYFCDGCGKYKRDL